MGKSSQVSELEGVRGPCDFVGSKLECMRQFGSWAKSAPIVQESDTFLERSPSPSFRIMPSAKGLDHLR